MVYANNNCGKYWRFWEQKLSESPEKFENIPNLRIAFPLLGIISSVSNQYLEQRREVLRFFEQACKPRSYASSKPDQCKATSV